MLATPAANREILELVGSIVLSAQTAESHLKAFLPFTVSSDPSIRSALERAKRIQKKTLGPLRNEFVKNSTSDVNFQDALATIVTARNNVVHHFTETYGDQLRQVGPNGVAASLRTVLASIRNFETVFGWMALHLFEGLRETTLRNTPHYEHLGTLCEMFRSQLEVPPVHPASDVGD